MMAQQVPHQPTDKKRVKVYELRDNDWFDRGTGFCSANFSVADDNQQPKDPKVIVQSEDEPDRLLLETRISKSDEFQKQQDTLIVWTEPSSGVDMALSFQEADGCSMIWKFINSIQQTVLGMNGGPDDSLSDDLMDVPNQVSLPPAELGNLVEIENIMRTLNQSASGRDALAKYVVTESYILKLIPLVEVAEDFESVEDLHRLCNIMKMIILLNDTTIIEHAVSDECILGVVGALEYDPDFPTHKANHRQWLGSQNRYKEVVPIDDETIRRKIHQTYRLQYLKDVVLARILDDPTFSVLNSLIFFNQVDIVQHLLGNGQFLNDLFSIFTSQEADHKKRKDAVLFIQQCCSIAKNLQPPARQSLYNNFIAHGLLHVVKFGLRHVDVGVRCASTDILVAMIDHDPQMIRQTIYRQISEKISPLTDSLIDLLLVEVDLGVKSQISDALKVLLDQCPPQIQPAESYAKGAAEFQARARAMGNVDPQQEMFLVHFYDHSAKRLFKPLLDLEGRSNIRLTNQQASMFGYLIEIISFFIRQHQHRAKYFLMNNHIPQRVLQLLSCQEKYLKLVAIRFFRHLLAMNDPFYLKQLNEQQVFGPVLETLVKAMSRDNLLTSAGLDLFEFVRKENIGDVMKHLVESYRDTLVSLSHFDTFRDMIRRYDQTQGFTVNPEVLVEMAEPDDGRRPNAPSARGFSEHLAVDEAQEEYWNASDDEDDQHPKAEKTIPATNGNSAPSRPLVDYTSDEEENEAPEGDKALSTDGTVETPTAITEDAAKSPLTASKKHAVQPPERLSEKRRRQEDDDDELGKLMQNKRRNSNSASANASQSFASSLRKKKSSINSTSPGAAGKKISINLNNSAVTTVPPATTEEAGEAQG